MKETNTKVLYFGLAVLFLAILACGENYTPIDPEDIKADDLSGQYFEGSALAGADLSNKNLSNADFRRANLENANFSNSDLRGAKFNGAVLLGADFTNAKLDERWIPIIDLLTTWDGTGQDFQGVNLSHVFLPGADLSSADLRSANLSGTMLNGANLSEANLSGADLRSTHLHYAILHDANLTDVKLDGRTNFSRASLVGVNIAPEVLMRANLSCTRMPDGTIYNEEDCNGTPPPP